MSNLEFLAVGYGVVWVIIAAYVWFVAHRQAAADVSWISCRWK